MNTNIFKYIASPVWVAPFLVALCAFALPTPSAADGQPPEEVRKTPFEPKKELRDVERVLRACRRELPRMEKQALKLERQVKEAEQQHSRDKQAIVDQNARIKVQKKKIKDNDRTLARGKFKNGDALSSEAVAQLTRTNKAVKTQLNRDVSRLGNLREIAASSKGHIRSMKTIRKDFISLHRAERAKCAKAQRTANKLKS